ncbi:hypothetical protein DFJ74DRAFT_703050 [Hyaloraphidium curvatum]|nr:hypothetical protein DFJ74DRAFT_703050 [Hyaloraphidium curvatum]
MSCPGTFLFGQRHASPGGRIRDAPDVDPNAAFLRPPCATCASIPGALVSRALLLEVAADALPPRDDGSRWDAAMFARSARKMADTDAADGDLWAVSSTTEGTKLLLVFLNALRKKAWLRAAQLAGFSPALSEPAADYTPLFPSPAGGMSPHPSPQPPALRQQDPSFSPDVLADAALRLSLLLGRLAGSPPPPVPDLARLLDAWLRQWHIAVSSGRIVPLTDAGAVVQGGALVEEAGDDEGEEGFFPRGEGEGTAVGSVVAAVGMYLRDRLAHGAQVPQGTVFATCCGRASPFGPAGPAEPHPVCTSFASVPVCARHPHDLAACKECAEAGKAGVSEALAVVGVEKKADGKFVGDFVAVGSAGAKMNLNPLAVLSFISMLPGKYFDLPAPSAPTTLSDLLALYPPPPPAPSALPSPILDLAPDLPEDIWSDTLESLYDFCCAGQAALGVPGHAGFAGVLAPRGGPGGREVYGADVADGAGEEAGLPPGQKAGTHA